MNDVATPSADSSLPSVASTLTGAYNRAHLASCLRRSAQVLLRETSDTLGALSEIANMAKEKIW